MPKDPKLVRSESIGSYYYWSYDGVLDAETAAKKQQEAGFHPGGYGFYSHKVKDGVTTWQSANNCD